jgi:hypothetical protein
VSVPALLKKQPQLVLQIGLNMAVKIPDLEVLDDAICCTLSFSRRPHYCYVPWSAIYALVGEDGRGMVWPEDIPPEVATQSAASPAGTSSTQTGPTKSEARKPDQRRARISVVPDAGSDTAKVDTAKVDTAKVDTLKVDTAKVDTLKTAPKARASKRKRAEPRVEDDAAAVNPSAKLRPSERPYLRLVRK